MMTHPSQANYLLIDGALRPGTLAGLYQRFEPIEIDPLYLGTRWQDLHDLGPILVKPEPGSALLSDWLIDEQLHADSTLIYSTAPIQQVAKHLRRFINPPDCHGGSGLLRFADPVVAHFWLSSFPEGSSLHLGPIEHWWVGVPRRHWEPQPSVLWGAFSGSGDGSIWDEHHAVLGEDQLAALDQAQHWRFLGRVHAWLGELNPSFLLPVQRSLVSGWLHASLQAGLAWGLVTERALVIWVEACVDDGLDFATRPNSAYQQWLTSDKANAGLAPEVRIRVFDTYRQSQKEFAHGG